MKKVTDIVAEIAAASREQSSGIEQVNKAVMQMDETTQQNAALVEEAAAASQAIVEQAQALNAMIARYNVGSAGAARRARARQRAVSNVVRRIVPWSATGQAARARRRPRRRRPGVERVLKIRTPHYVIAVRAAWRHPVSRRRPWTAPALSLSAAYTGDLRRNTSGGMSVGTAYSDAVDLGLSWTTDGLFSGARVTGNVAVMHLGGEGISGEYVGDYQGINNIESPPGWYLYESWVELSFGEEADQLARRRARSQRRVRYAGDAGPVRRLAVRHRHRVLADRRARSR